MGSSKTFILLIGLAFAIVLLIGSEVAAKDLAETTTSTLSAKDKKDQAANVANGVKDAKYDQGYGGFPGGGYGGNPGGGYGGGGYPGRGGGYGGRGGGYGGRGGYGGGRGGYGGGRGGYGGGRGRGCYYGYCRYGCCKAADAQTQTKPQN